MQGWTKTRQTGTLKKTDRKSVCLGIDKADLLESSKWKLDSGGMAKTGQ